MTYKFKCEKCGKKFLINMSICEYTTEGHKCDECGEKLNRDYEDIAATAIWKTTGAYGKSSN